MSDGILQIYTENVFHHAWFQLNWTNFMLAVKCCVRLRLWKKEEVTIIQSVDTRLKFFLKYLKLVAEFISEWISVLNPI